MMARTVSGSILLRYGLGVLGGFFVTAGAALGDVHGFRGLSETRLIAKVLPIQHQKADDVAAIVRQAYADRLARVVGGQVTGDVTVVVDNRLNAMVIVAPDDLLPAVAVLVMRLDEEPDGILSCTARGFRMSARDESNMAAALRALLGEDATVQLVTGQQAPAEATVEDAPADE